MLGRGGGRLQETRAFATQGPRRANSNRCYFCYGAIAKFIGAHMARFKLPECVECHIEYLYPRDSNVAAVGFQA